MTIAPPHPSPNPSQAAVRSCVTSRGSGGNPITEVQLAQIAVAWPACACVQHQESGWTGRITPDPHVDLPGADIHLGHAHGLLFDGEQGRSGALVSVVWDPQYDPAGAPAWMRARSLRLLTEQGPGPHD
jgi:hypothetical protein